MLKSVIAATAALAIAGSSLVYAQQRSAPGYGGPGGGDRPRAAARMSTDDLNAIAEARIAGLKAGLTLTPDQEKHWPAYEQAQRDMSKWRIEHGTAMGGRMRISPEGARPVDPIERLQHRADALATYSAVLAQLAKASAPLYQSLDEGQKRRFVTLSYILRPIQRSRGERSGQRFERGPGGNDGWRRGRDGSLEERRGESDRAWSEPTKL